MIKVLIGDLFDSQAQTLVNTVNCVGVMGKGVALGFKKHFPDMFKDYVAKCEAGQVKLGKPYIYRRLIPPSVLNFPTKDHWRSVANIQDIVEGLQYLQSHFEEWGITSLAVPPLGCGEGQLEWRVVGPTLYRYLGQLGIPVELYAPYGTPSEQMSGEFLGESQELATAGPGQGRVLPGWVALVEILSRLEVEPYHRPVGRTMLQKIAYFATESGLPTTLTYSKGSYGPFAQNLKFRITQLANNGLISEEPVGNMFMVKVGPTFQDAIRTYEADLVSFAPIVDKVTDLFLRIKTTRQAEIAATVHFAAGLLAEEESGCPSESDVLSHVIDWKKGRRPPLDKTEVAVTIRNLASLGWIKVRPSQDMAVAEYELLEFED